jgi:hypothetical protein
MTAEEWGIVIGVILSGLLALAPWMLMVHAKLAVLTTTIESLAKKVDKLIDDNEQRQPMCAVHATRLDAVESQLVEIHNRLRGFDCQKKEPGQA